MQVTINVNCRGHQYSDHGRIVGVDKDTCSVAMYEDGEPFPTSYQLQYIQSIISDITSEVLYQAKGATSVYP